MTIGDLAGIITKLNTIPDGLATKDIKPQPDPENLDQMFSDSSKRHRNWMARLDHVYEFISHPFMIFLVFFIILIAFLVFRYLDIYHCGDNKVFSQIHKDAKTTITYLGAVILTWAITKVLEGRTK